jgi:hypothetical protein
MSDKFQLDFLSVCAKGLAVAIKARTVVRPDQIITCQLSPGRVPRFERLLMEYMEIEHEF